MKPTLQISKNLVRLAVGATLVGLATGCYNREMREDKISPTNAHSTVTSPSPQPSEKTSTSANSSQNKNSPSRVPTTDNLPSPIHSNSPSKEESPESSTEATPLEGSWKLQHSVHGIVHQSTLDMKGNSGKMLTSFFNLKTNQTETVEQTMKLPPSAKGLVLLGSNPIDTNTKTRHPTYSADNFLFQITPHGLRDFQTCDDAGRCSPVEIQQIDSKQN